MSFANRAPDEELAERLREFDRDPLWPALARPVARAGTDADRELLEDLAAPPKKRAGVLGWGLKYWVRGDVLLAECSELSLDALWAGHGLEPLPSLVDLPADLDLGFYAYAIRHEAERSVAKLGVIDPG